MHGEIIPGTNLRCVLPHHGSHVPCTDDVDEARMMRIETELQTIRDELAFIRDTIIKADTTITTVAAQVMPTVNDLMKSPILKMLGMNK